MQKSKVLVIIIGSNHKRTGGGAEYRRDQSILHMLPDIAANRLIKGRARVLRWIFEGGISRHGKLISEMPSNVGLVNGPEFGGTIPGSQYMPAAARFRGRLFGQLEPDAADLLTTTRHHVLILTGLYGLVTPTELIQDHQVHIDDHRNLHKFWTEGDLLTDVLVAYIKQHGITTIIDMTAQNSYRFLIAWERIRHEAKSVLHCYGAQSAGDELLIPLGALAREMLSKGSESRLTAITDGMHYTSPFEQIYFQKLAQPPALAPREIQLQQTRLNFADELGRMRRCFIRFMDALSAGAKPTSDEGVVGRIRSLERAGRISTRVAGHMIEITRERNTVEYENRYPKKPAEMEAVRKRFSAVTAWAQTKRLKVPPECLEL